MTRLEWGATGEKFYDAGVDHGVLYVDGVGVPWNGLISVEEAPTGGEAKPFYQDGYKYSNRATPEEFEATLNAFTYPDEFARCDGSSQIGRGLFATNQRRKPFTLCYRTKVGNDVNGVDHGYKLHLVYNALAAPSQRTNNTLGDSVEATSFSWALTTKPPALFGRRATAHFIIDSRATSPSLLTQIEDILYGTADEAPRIMTVQELTYRFEVDASGNYDAGLVGKPQYLTLDAGVIPVAQTSTLDGGFA